MTSLDYGKAMRQKAHQRFDLLWKFKGMTRTQAYRWLAKEMGLNKDQCHMLKMDVKQCQRVIELSEKKLGWINETT